MIVIIFLLIIFPMFIFAEKRPGRELLLKIQTDNENRAEGLVSVGNSKYQIIFMEFKEPGKEILNIYTPYALLGRIASAGLLKEIKNPVSHYPASQVFNEKTQIIPDRKLKETGNNGIRIDAGNILSGFMEEGESSLSHLSWRGLYSGQKIGEKILINFAVAEYKERDDSESDIWYSDRKIRYGRKVINSAFSISYKNSFWGINGAGAINYYKGADNGIYFRLSPYLKYSFIRFDFLLSGTNDSYIKPDGTLSSTALRKGASALLTPFPWIRFNVRYVTDVLQKKESDIRYGGYTEELFGSVIFKPWFFESGASVKNRNIYKDNYFDNYMDTAISIGLKAGFNKIVFEKKETYKNYDKISQSYKLEAGTKIKNFTIYLCGKIKEEIDEEEKSVMGRLNLKIRNFSLFSKYEIVSLEKRDSAPKMLNTYSAGLEARF